jgi:hypothetical protein
VEGSKSEQSSALDDCQHADNGVFQDEERVAMEADAMWNERCQCQPKPVRI